MRICSSKCEGTPAILPKYRIFEKLKNGESRLGITWILIVVTKRYCRYTDYFQFLYRSIEARLKGELASRWEDAKIEFIFSVPTTWKPNPTVERFKKIIASAGFGSCPSHIASIGLTEAEAAAVHTARSMPGIFTVRDGTGHYCWCAQMSDHFT